MAERRPLTALGLMSGTSMDGIDAALIETDGTRIVHLGRALTVAYEPAFRQSLRAVLGADGEGDERVALLARELTLRHARAVARLLGEDGDDGGLRAADIDVIGFHGHTVLHRPGDGVTRQIGDGALLARETGIPVVDDFRSRDLAAGGEGAPLAPLYHAALAAGLEKPLAVLNLGGVANLTWLGPAGEIVAFDTGPGNALIDDWVLATAGRPMDQGGALAAAGRVDKGLLSRLLAHPYFDRPAPKSLDRDAFRLDRLGRLSPEDGAATLTIFTAAAVARAARHLPAPPRRWLVAGGGRHNPTLMAALEESLEGPVEPVEAVGWRGDALEAQAFAHLAVRSLYGLPLSLPSTTGVARPMTGGTLHPAPGRRRPA